MNIWNFAPLGLQPIPILQRKRWKKKLKDFQEKESMIERRIAIIEARIGADRGEAGTASKADIEKLDKLNTMMEDLRAEAFL